MIFSQTAPIISGNILTFLIWYPQMPSNHRVFYWRAGASDDFKSHRFWRSLEVPQLGSNHTLKKLSLSNFCFRKFQQFYNLKILCHNFEKLYNFWKIFLHWYVILRQLKILNVFIPLLLWFRHLKLKGVTIAQALCCFRWEIRLEFYQSSFFSSK